MRADFAAVEARQKAREQKERERSPWTVENMKRMASFRSIKGRGDSDLDHNPR